MKRRELLAGLALAPATAFAPAAVWAQALPPPAHGAPGRLRIAGTSALAPVVAAWTRAFAAHNPAVRIETALHGSDLAMAALYTAQCDIALLGRDATKPEVQAFEWIYRFRPRSIAVLRGSVASPGCSPALAVLVHRDNPVASLRIDQLRAAFGDEGIKARTWGDLGLDGEWQDRSIRLYAPEAESGTGRFFRDRVLDGSNHMAWPLLREFPVPPVTAQADDQAALAMRRALAHDPLGLAIGAAVPARGLRTVALIGADGVARVPDATSVQTGSYPLARTVNACFAQAPERLAHAETTAFLRYILSPAAQQLAAAAGHYLPLPTDLAGQSLSGLP